MWRREWDSNPRTLARRRFSRPVPSTARTSLHHGKAPSVGRLIIILYRLAICQQSAPIFIFLIFFILGVAFPETVCYYNSADFEQHISGCGAVGSALDWGSRGREFKSRHSDQSKHPNWMLRFFYFHRHLPRLVCDWPHTLPARQCVRPYCSEYTGGNKHSIHVVQIAAGVF